MNPSIYYYNETDAGFELHLGECSIEEGLRMFDVQDEIIITRFGATSYQDYGWATEAELPKIGRLGAAITFFQEVGDIGIIEFEATLPETGIIRSHNDGEFQYIANSRRKCISVLRKLIPEQHRDILINKLFNNPGLYFTCSTSGEVKKYNSFNEYVAKNGS